MRVAYRLARSGAWLAFMLAPLLAGCAASATSSPTVGPATATSKSTATASKSPGASCATTASATAEAWDFNQQVEGSVNGGAVTLLSNFQYPLGIQDEGAVGNLPQPGLIVWAPDAKHFAVAILQDVPFSTEYDPYIVDSTSHVVTKVPLPHPITVPSEGTGRRIFSWADKHTLIILEPGNGTTGGAAYSYDITSTALSILPGVSGAEEGVVRCGTLFYLSYGPFSPVLGAPTNNGYGATKATGLLNRYTLATRSALGTPIPLGDVSTYPGAEGQITALGWDVSPDGAKIAYQQTTTSYTAGNVMTSSTFYAANADGTGKVRILTQATSNSPAFVAISPNGQVVAVTAANPTPNVLSGNMDGTSMRAYTPDSDSRPAWLADSSGFDTQLQGSQGISAGLYRYLLSTPLNSHEQASATEVDPGGHNPATLP